MLLPLSVYQFTVYSLHHLPVVFSVGLFCITTHVTVIRVVVMSSEIPTPATIPTNQKIIEHITNILL